MSVERFAERGTLALLIVSTVAALAMVAICGLAAVARFASHPAAAPHIALEIDG